LEPSWRAPLDNLTKLYVVQGQTATAGKNLEAKIKAKPDNVNAYRLLAQVYVIGEEYDKATSTYEKILEKEPGNRMAANDLAYLLSERGASKKDLTRARELAEKALTDQPNEPSVQDTAGWVYFRQGDVNRASDLIAKAHKLLPDNPDVNYHMGMILYKAGRLAEAKQYLTKAVQSGMAFIGKEEAQKTLKRL